MAAAGGDVHQDIHGADSTPDQGSLGGLVRAHRARLGLTQEELAERAELSERTLRNLEGGRIRRPYPDTIRRLADALQLTDRHRDQLEATARGITAELGSEGTGPSLLPPSVTDFTGRQEEVASVLELLATDGLQEGPHTVVISALAGKPGIGKTTLAVHVAHRLRDRFSDGQLYVIYEGWGIVKAWSAPGWLAGVVWPRTRWWSRGPVIYSGGVAHGVVRPGRLNQAGGRCTPRP
jgi:transcriptional regulator with XRE-family HTH domain